MQLCHSHIDCISSAIQEAETLCKTRETRLTPIRRKILELVWQSHSPSKAYDILSRFRHEIPSAEPPTIYRALDFLLKERFIHKIEHLNAYIGCMHPQSSDSCFFLICKNCHHIQELSKPALSDTIAQTLNEHFFSVQHVSLEIQGLCKACKDNSNFD